MDIKIEKATINDLDEIQKLNQLLFINEQKRFDSKYDTNWPYEEEGIEYFTKELNDVDRTVFIAKDGDKIIGYLAASSEIDQKYIGDIKVAELDNMFVLDEYRGKGIGTDLVNRLKDWAKEISAGRIIVTASYGNNRGIKFYKDQGFENFDIALKINL